MLQFYHILSFFIKEKKEKKNSISSHYCWHNLCSTKFMFQHNTLVPLGAVKPKGQPFC